MSDRGTKQTLTYLGPPSVGRRVVVTGMTGAGKSTFSRALAAKTGLPLIYLDLLFWKPGWVEPGADEWREKQRVALAGEEWIADGNYHETLDLRLERADTVVFLDTPWWICSRRAFKRGIRRPPGTQMPDGCIDSMWRRVRDEWRAAFWRIWRGRDSERERELAIISRHGTHATVYTLSSEKSVQAFLDGLDSQPHAASQ